MCRILINALQFSNDGAGISRYSYELANILMKNNSNIDVLCREEVIDKFEIRDRLIPIKVKNNIDRILIEQVKLLKLYKKYDIVHFLDYATPILYRGRKFATIHDMTMHTMKDKYTKTQIFTKTKLINSTIKKAENLICISDFTKNELLKYYPNINENRIKVIHNGFKYEKVELKEREKKEIINKFEISKNYLLFVGTISPHKNIERIIEAFSKIIEKNYDYELVICGKKGWLYKEIYKKAVTLEIEDKVKFTGYVTENELEVLYQNAKLFVFPSLYEGFGFPPLEAMARNIPVLASREGAIPECVGDAAVFCDAYNAKDISEKMIEVLSQDMIKEKMINKGKMRVEKFSWEKTREKIESLYKK